MSKQYIDIGDTRLEDDNGNLVIKSKTHKGRGSVSITNNISFSGTVDLETAESVAIDNSKTSGLGPYLIDGGDAAALDFKYSYDGGNA